MKAKIQAEITDIESRFTVFHQGSTAIDWLKMRNHSQELFVKYIGLRQQMRELT